MKRPALCSTSLPFTRKRRLNSPLYLLRIVDLIIRVWRIWVMFRVLSMSTRRLLTASYIFVRSCFLVMVRIIKRGI